MKLEEMSKGMFIVCKDKRCQVREQCGFKTVHEIDNGGKAWRHSQIRKDKLPACHSKDFPTRETKGD